jgi:hypothetical protein
VSTSEHFKSVSQGLVLIKGKGQMEVYDISLNEPAAFYRRQSASRVAVTRTRISMTSSSPSESSAAASVEGGSNEAPQMAQEEAQLQANAAQLMAQEETQWQAWLEERHTLSRFMRRFSNTETENAYLKSSCFVQRQGLTMGFLFHLVATAWQWSVITLPDQGPIFHHYGNLELIWRTNVTQALLAGQFIVSIALSCIAFFLLGHIRMGINIVREFLIRHRWISDPEQLILSDEVFDAMDLGEKPQNTVALSKQTVHLCNVLYVMLKILNVAIMLRLGFVWPSRCHRSRRAFLAVFADWVSREPLYFRCVICKQHCTGSAQPSSYCHCHVPSPSEVFFRFEFHRGVRRGSDERATKCVYYDGHSHCRFRVCFKIRGFSPSHTVEPRAILHRATGRHSQTFGGSCPAFLCQPADVRVQTYRMFARSCRCVAAGRLRFHRDFHIPTTDETC